MGLAVADDDDDSPIPSPSTWNNQFRRPEETAEPLELRKSSDQGASMPPVSTSPLSPIRYPSKTAVWNQIRSTKDISEPLGSSAEHLGTLPLSPVRSSSTTVAWNQLRRPEDGAESLEVRPATDHGPSLPLVAASALRRPAVVSRKRLFDVDSLLAPDAEDKPEPEVNSTFAFPRRDRHDAFPVLPPERKRRAVSPEVDSDDVMSRQPIRAAICDDDSPNTTSGIKPMITDDALDVMTSPDKTGNGIASTHVETTSGERTFGMCAADAKAMTRFWLRHTNMASTPLAKSLFPFPVSTAYHVTCLSDDAERGQGRGEGQFEGHDMKDFKGLSLGMSGPVGENNSIS